MKNEPSFSLPSADSPTPSHGQDSFPSPYSHALKSEPTIPTGEMFVETGKEQTISEKEGVETDLLHSPSPPSAQVWNDGSADVRDMQEVPNMTPTTDESDAIEPTEDAGFSSPGREEEITEGDPLDTHPASRTSSFSLSPAPPFFSFPPVPQNDALEINALYHQQDRTIPEEEEGRGNTEWKVEEPGIRDAEKKGDVEEEQNDEEEDEEGSEVDAYDALVVEVSGLEAEKHIQGLLQTMTQRLAKQEETSLQKCIQQQRDFTTSLATTLEAHSKKDDTTLFPQHSVPGVVHHPKEGELEGEDEKKGRTDGVPTDPTRRATAPAAVGVSSPLVPSTLRRALAYLTAVEVSSLADTQRNAKRRRQEWRIIEEQDETPFVIEGSAMRESEMGIGKAIKKRKTEREGGMEGMSTEASGDGPPSSENHTQCALPVLENDDTAAHGLATGYHPTDAFSPAVAHSERLGIAMAAKALRTEIATVLAVAGKAKDVPLPTSAEWRTTSSSIMHPRTPTEGVAAEWRSGTSWTGETENPHEDEAAQSRWESRIRFGNHIHAFTQKIAAEARGSASGEWKGDTRMAAQGEIVAAEDATEANPPRRRPGDDAPEKTRAVSLWNGTLQDALALYGTAMALLQATQHIRTSAISHWHTLCHRSPVSSPSSFDCPLAFASSTANAACQGDHPHNHPHDHQDLPIACGPTAEPSATSPPAAGTSATSFSFSQALVQQAMSRCATTLAHATDEALVEMIQRKEDTAAWREKRRAVGVGIVTRLLTSLASCPSPPRKRTKAEPWDVIANMTHHLQEAWKKTSLSPTAIVSAPFRFPSPFLPVAPENRTATTTPPPATDAGPPALPPPPPQTSPFFTWWAAPVASLDADIAYWSAMGRQLQYDVGVWYNRWNAVQANARTTEEGQPPSTSMSLVSPMRLPEEETFGKAEGAKESDVPLVTPRTSGTPALHEERDTTSVSPPTFSLPSSVRSSCPSLYALATSIHTLLHAWRMVLYRQMFSRPPHFMTSSSSSARLTRLCGALTSDRNAAPASAMDATAWPHASATSASDTAAETEEEERNHLPATLPSLPSGVSLLPPYHCSPSSLFFSSSSFPPGSLRGGWTSHTADGTRGRPLVASAFPFAAEESRRAREQEEGVDDTVDQKRDNTPSSSPSPSSCDAPCDALRFRRLQLQQMVASRQRTMEALLQQNAFLYAWICHAPRMISLLTPPPSLSTFDASPASSEKEEAFLWRPADVDTTPHHSTGEEPPSSSSSSSLSGLVDEANAVWRLQEQHLSSYATELQKLQATYLQHFAHPVHAVWKTAEEEREKMFYAVRVHVLKEHHHTQRLLSHAAAAATTMPSTAGDKSSCDAHTILLHSPYYRADVRALSRYIQTMRAAFPPTVASSSSTTTTTTTTTHTPSEEEASPPAPPLCPFLSVPLPVLPTSLHALLKVYAEAWEKCDSTALQPCVQEYRTVLTSLQKQEYHLRRWAAMVVSSTTATSDLPPLPSALRTILEAQRQSTDEHTEDNAGEGENTKERTAKDVYTLPEIHRAAKEEVAQLEQKLAALQEETARRARQKAEMAQRQENRLLLRSKRDELRRKIQQGRAELAQRAMQTIHPEEKEASTEKEVRLTPMPSPVPKNADENDDFHLDGPEILNRVDGLEEAQGKADGDNREEVHEREIRLDAEETLPQDEEEGGELAVDEEEALPQDEEEGGELAVDEEEGGELAVDEEEGGELAVGEDDALPQDEEEGGELAVDEDDALPQDEEEGGELAVDEEEALHQDEEEGELAVDEEEALPQDEEGGKGGTLSSPTLTSSFGKDSFFHNPFASDW